MGGHNRALLSSSRHFPSPSLAMQFMIPGLLVAQIPSPELSLVPASLLFPTSTFQSGSRLFPVALLGCELPSVVELPNVLLIGLTVSAPALYSPSQTAKTLHQ